MNLQPRLFDLSSSPRRASRSALAKLDADSEALLQRFRAQRSASGAHERTVEREVSQLRSLARAGGRAGAALSLSRFIEDPRVLARALLDPPEQIAASTGRSRLIAAQRFIQTQSAEPGVDPVGALDVLDGLLPNRGSRGWYSAGTVVAGGTRIQRSGCPTLYPPDLERIVFHASSAADYLGLRDWAIVALHCWSGLRQDEIVHLRRSAVISLHTDDAVVVVVRRSLSSLRLVVPAPGAQPLLALCRDQLKTGSAADGYLFGRVRSAEQPLTSRAVRAIVRRACERAGFPRARAVDLRAAFGYALRLRGLSDHETAATLGLSRVKTLDRLLANHYAIDAQRLVREAVSI